MNLAKSSIKLFVVNVFGAVLQFVGVTFFARELGASQMGTFFLFQALLGILAIPADFGLRGAVEKRISEGDSPEAYLSSVILLKLAPISIIILVILLLRPIINNYLGADLALLLSLGLVLQEGAKLAVFVLKGELRVGETAELRLVQQGTWVIGGAVFVIYGYAVEALVLSLLAGFTIMLLWGWYKSSLTLGRPSVGHARSLADYGKFNMVSSIGGYFYSWMDIAIIGLFLTQTEVGAYEIAWKVTALTVILSRAIATSLFPQVSLWDAEDADHRIESLIHTAITPSVILTIPAFFGSLVFSREILGLVFGPEFTIASVVLIILAAEKILQSVHSILGRALQGINRPNLAARATVISVSLNVILNIILILSFGIVGAAIATTISFATNTILHGWYLSRFIEVRFPYQNVGWCVLSSILMALILVGVQSFIGVETLLELLFTIVFGALVYLVTVLLFRPIRTSFVANLRNLTHL